MHDVMAGYVDRGDVPGIVTLVSRHGEVQVDAIGMKTAGGRDPMRRDTIFRIASLTKPIAAAAPRVGVRRVGGHQALRRRGIRRNVRLGRRPGHLGARIPRRTWSGS
jgi:hypothetical protein